MPDMTVVFADLAGSTGVFEVLGNAKATQAITRITHWMAALFEKHGGRVIKHLGDGVLVVFARSTAAVDALVAMERLHQLQLQKWPAALQLPLKVGIARGDVLVQNGDCFGDAVNMAARLSDLSGAEQILATESVIDDLHGASAYRYRSMGIMDVRGRNEPCVVFRLEWQEDIGSEYLTVPGVLLVAPATAPVLRGKHIVLSTLSTQRTFSSGDMPVFLGRDSDAHFVVDNLRVSRLHAKLEWRNGLFMLSDLSTYGTWVKYAGTDTVVSLRRKDCVLPEQGDIALGRSFKDLNVPTIQFHTPAAV